MKESPQHSPTRGAGEMERVLASMLPDEEFLYIDWHGQAHRHPITTLK
jgi:hypothetical protein